MLCKVFLTGNCVVISLPREAMEHLNFHMCSQIDIIRDPVNQRAFRKSNEIPRASLAWIKNLNKMWFSSLKNIAFLGMRW